MSARDGQQPADLPRAPGGHRWLPFWVLQAVELAAALAFVDISVHVSNGGLLVGSAVAFAALAVTARGPLGLIRICGQRLHVALVIGVSVLVALAPVVPAFRPDIEGIIVVEFAAVGLIRLATFTQAGPVGRNAAGRGSRAVIEASAVVTESAPVTRTPSGPPSSGSPTDAAARWLGRTTGAAAAAGQRLAETHGPVAEEQVRRSIRSAGRWAGRLIPPRSDSEHSAE